MKTLLIILIFSSIANGINILCTHGKISWQVRGSPVKCDIYRAATCAKQNSKIFWPKCALSQDADIPKEFRKFCPNLIALNFPKCVVKGVSTSEAFQILGHGKTEEEFHEDWLPEKLDLTAVGFFKDRKKNFMERLVNDNLEGLETYYVNGNLCIKQIANDPNENLALKEVLKEKCPIDKLEL
jgi:hypothetical protein